MGFGFRVWGSQFGEGSVQGLERLRLSDVVAAVPYQAENTEGQECGLQPAMASAEYPVDNEQ